MKRIFASAPGQLAKRASAMLYRLALLNYRRVSRLYWELRAQGLSDLYGGEKADFPILRTILARYAPVSILDVGCGAGRLFPLFIECRVPRVLGIDISGRAIGLARRRFPSVLARRVRVEDMQTGEQYDLVIANRVLQHLLPGTLPRAIRTLCSTARLAIYVNEVSDSEHVDISGVRYIFKHNYEELFAGHGWHLAEKGAIPGTSQTYMLFTPESMGHERGRR